MILVFCFKQKTAYEMRISDWSSDVCSSDLYVAFSKGMVEKIWGAVAPSDMLVLLIILSLLLAVVLLLTGFIGRRLLSFSIEDEIVLPFCGSKKSLASGLPIASVLFPGPTLGPILLPLLLFHHINTSFIS